MNRSAVADLLITYVSLNVAKTVASGERLPLECPMLGTGRNVDPFKECEHCLCYLLGVTDRCCLCNAGVEKK